MIALKKYYSLFDLKWRHLSLSPVFWNPSYKPQKISFIFHFIGSSGRVNMPLCCVEYTDHKIEALWCQHVWLVNCWSQIHNAEDISPETRWTQFITLLSLHVINKWSTVHLLQSVAICHHAAFGLWTVCSTRFYQVLYRAQRQKRMCTAPKSFTEWLHHG